MLARSYDLSDRIKGDRKKLTDGLHVHEAVCLVLSS
jgi:hypothetical protein